MLEVNKMYWIFDGQMQPIYIMLFDIVNQGRTAVFNEYGNIARKVSSVYQTKEQALKANIY